MKVVQIVSPGGTEVLKIVEREVPKIKATEVLIQVVAAGLNRADIAQRKGNYPAPQGAVQDVLGLEVSGKIIAVGEEVKNFQLGDEVCALLAGGGYAEYVAVDAGSCLPVPRNIPLPDASALPEVLFTVWSNVFQRGKLQKGEKVLFYGASGGIGSMGIQLAKQYGAHPIAVVSTEEKAMYCLSLGAEKVIYYHKENLLDVLGKESVDVILDPVGGIYFEQNIELLKREGRLLYNNAMQGGKVNLNIFKIMQKCLYLSGSTLRSRSVGFKAALAQEVLEKAYPLIESPAFKNMVRHRFAVENVVQAHKLMDSRDFFGKIILEF